MPPPPQLPSSRSGSDDEQRAASSTGDDDEETEYSSQKGRGRRGRTSTRSGKDADTASVQPAKSRPSRDPKPQQQDHSDGSSVVSRVVEELRDSPVDKLYKVEFRDGREKDISLQELTSLSNGPKALDVFVNTGSASPSQQSSSEMGQNRSSRREGPSSLARKRTRNAKKDIDYTSQVQLSSSSEEDGDETASYTRKRQRMSTRAHSKVNDSRSREVSGTAQDVTDEDDLDTNDDGKNSLNGLRASRQRKPASRVTRSSGIQSHQQLKTLTSSVASKDITGSENDADELGSDVKIPVDRPNMRKATQTGRSKPQRQASAEMRPALRNSLKPSERSAPHSRSSTPDRPGPSRRSARSTKSSANMRERLDDEEVFATDDNPTSTPKIAIIRESFRGIASDPIFNKLHRQECDVCEGRGTASNKGISVLIPCQGCTTSIHQLCLGNRTTRDHVVTKVGDNDFVLQCRRCIGAAKRKDELAPNLGTCSACKSNGAACAPFSVKKTTKQEEKLRQDNGGVDPVTAVKPNLINNPDNVLFRCETCHRGFHFEHLPRLDQNVDDPPETEELKKHRQHEYRRSSQCGDCNTCAEEDLLLQTLVAWRPSDTETYVPGSTVEMLVEDQKEYLVKWVDRSYFRCTWMPGSWVWGMTKTTTRKSFARQPGDKNLLPKMNETDAIPEEFLRVEIVLDVEYGNRISSRIDAVDRSRQGQVTNALVKFQGLSYDEVCWEKPPKTSETERYADYFSAYLDFVSRQCFSQPTPKLKERLQDYRSLDFEKSVMMEEQPISLTGGKLMPYQLEGLNWLLYNFHRQKNVILADEMGLGKTIQIVALLATLIKDKPNTYPFLVVVPNSTCPNWKREIKQWAPSLRVVAYYGPRAARNIASEYELFPNNSKDLRAHVVVTSYEAPVDESSRDFFRKIKWSGLIVDEGQRLKNENNLLYIALNAMKVGFRVLLTGTPLQNNTRELFNLLQFLDPELDAASLDEKYAELTNENLSELHDLLRPYFLRRTKAQVLKFLPPMAQVIIPVTMSVVQKKLYKSILAKNPELIKSIFGSQKSTLRPNERGSLNNILMQLRKCLCHPFVYSDAIEERSNSHTVLHRNLVDASSKLQLLEIMLPKLKERGHRVLLFSQFLAQLDIIEDFLEALGMQYRRLDGNITTLEKQKRIDAFNAPESPIFAFLLSTRAGGVGINLATADTVIIMDPDFNPHQDIQALSRAHRIGQKKKVLVFQLMTKDSAEEKIVQIGRKKMALDHALIESMDADDEAGVDLDSILKHGAANIFNDNDENDIRYDSASVDKLLDRSQIESTSTGDDKSAESQFSYARVWANDKATLTDEIGNPDNDEAVPNPTVWDNILKQRQADAEREAALKEETLGRGKRVRQAVDYQRSNFAVDSKQTPRKGRRPVGRKSDSDTDFAEMVEEVEEESEGENGELIKDNDLSLSNPTSKSHSQSVMVKQVNSLRRAKPAPNKHNQKSYSSISNSDTQTPYQSGSNGYSRDYSKSGAENRQCPACGTSHAIGYCTMKRTGVEYCPFCGLAHFGIPDVCPHFSSEMQVRLKLDALKVSVEPRYEVDAAREALREILSLVIRNKEERRASKHRESQPPL